MIDPSAVPDWVQLVAAIITIGMFVYGRLQAVIGRDDLPEWLQDVAFVVAVVLIFLITVQFVFPPGGGGGGPGGGGDGGDGNDLRNGHFEIIPTADDETLAYRFTVDGHVYEAKKDGNQGDLGSGGEWEDTVVDSGDGTVTVTGKTGNQEGDVFRIEGELLEFERVDGGSGMRLEFDDDLVTGDLVDDPTAHNRTFEIISTSGDETFTYQFVVDGEAYEASADGNGGDLHTGTEWEDTIRDNGDGTVTVTGKEGLREGDVFLVNGEIVEFRKTGGTSGMRLELDDRDVTEEFLDESTAARLYSHP